MPEAPAQHGRVQPHEKPILLTPRRPIRRPAGSAHGEQNYTEEDERAEDRERGDHDRRTEAQTRRGVEQARRNTRNAVQKTGPGRYQERDRRREQ